MKYYFQIKSCSINIQNQASNWNQVVKTFNKIKGRRYNIKKKSKDLNPYVNISSVFLPNASFHSGLTHQFGCEEINVCVCNIWFVITD